MQQRSISGLTLFYDPDEHEAAQIIGDACERSVDLIRYCWELAMPKGCRVYVMTSCLGFIFGSAPWHRRLLLGLSLPLWYRKARNMWALAGGFNLPYRIPVVGIKPKRLLAASDRSLGLRIFIDETDLNDKVQSNVCHELVHAATSHLKLPLWLNEGLAMVTVDRYCTKDTVRPETLETLARSAKAGTPLDYRNLPGRRQKLSEQDKEVLIYSAVRGYWITRYVSESSEGFLTQLLTKRRSHQELEAEVADALNIPRGKFWNQIDASVVNHFKSALP